MSNIVQGDSGTVLNFTVKDEAGIVNLTSAASVSVTILFSDAPSVRLAQITDAANGKCRITLTSADTKIAGSFQFQATVKFSDGSEFSGRISKLTITPRLGA